MRCDSPLSLLLELQGQKHPFCLYSSGLDAFSYLGANPQKICKVYPRHLEIQGQRRELKKGEDPFSLLEKEFDLKGKQNNFFKSGWVGFWAYEMGQFSDEKFPQRDLPEDCLLAWWAYYDSIWVWDHFQQKFLHEGSPVPQSQKDNLNSEWNPPPYRLDEARYLSAVERVLAYIRAGDCYQVNIAQMFKWELDKDFSPIQEFVKLVNKHPAPFAAYLDCGSKKIISLSPEELLRMEGEKLRTSPIKGTRHRSSNPIDDEKIKNELANSEKEKAELLMIVDLERNDLGKICETASVRVSNLRKIVSFDYVHHALATIEGKKKQGLTALEATRSMFPGGSITGAPKKRAMEIIQELESEARGVYTGAIGFYAKGEVCHLNIAIRSLEIDGNRAKFGMGSGIVADSQPLDEFQEILTKSKVFR